MTAINSNRAIRGPVTAVPVVAGKGVRLVADTDNNRWVVEADETVLWEDADNTTQLYSGATSFNLSESYLNFERIRVYYRHSFSGSISSIAEAYVLGSNVRLGIDGYPQGDNAWILFDRALIQFLTTSPTTMTVSATTRAGLSISGSTITATTSNNGIVPIKVVGINRIASN